MKKIILTAGICLVSLLAVQAQKTDAKTSPTLDQRTTKMVGILTNTCKLTPDQVTKVKPVIAEAMKERMANKQQYATDKVKLKAANQATKKETNEKLNAIMNPDQQAKLLAFEQQSKTQIQKNKAAAAAKQK